jgi:hypothetical protein
MGSVWNRAGLEVSPHRFHDQTDQGIQTHYQTATAAAMATLFVLDWQKSVEESRVLETGIVTD